MDNPRRRRAPRPRLQKDYATPAGLADFSVLSHRVFANPVSRFLLPIPKADTWAIRIQYRLRRRPSVCNSQQKTRSMSVSEENMPDGGNMSTRLHVSFRKNSERHTCEVSLIIIDNMCNCYVVCEPSIPGRVHGQSSSGQTAPIRYAQLWSRSDLGSSAECLLF